MPQMMIRTKLPLHGRHYRAVYWLFGHLQCVLLDKNLSSLAESPIFEGQVPLLHDKFEMLYEYLHLVQQSSYLLTELHRLQIFSVSKLIKVMLSDVSTNSLVKVDIVLNLPVKLHLFSI